MVHLMEQGRHKKSRNKKIKADSGVVDENTTLAEVLAIPGAYEALAKLGVPCVVCPLMGMEMAYLTLDVIAQMYKLDLAKIIDVLNKLPQQGDKPKKGKKNW